MTEMDITFIFISYIKVTIQRQAKAFYRRCYKITYYENEEFIENIEIEKEIIGYHSRSESFLNDNFEEKLSHQEILLKGLSSLDETEKYIIREKFLNQRSDFDIGKDFSISGQMISKRKRKILSKLESFF